MPAGYEKVYGKQRLARIDALTADPRLWAAIVSGREKEAARAAAAVPRGMPATKRAIRLSGVSSSSSSSAKPASSKPALPSPLLARRRRAPARAARVPAGAARIRADKERIRRRRAGASSSSSSLSKRSSSAKRVGTVAAVGGLPLEVAWGVAPDARYKRGVLQNRKKRARVPPKRRVSSSSRGGGGSGGSGGAGPSPISAASAGKARRMRAAIAVRKRQALARKMPKEAAYGVLAEKMRRARKPAKKQKAAKRRA